MLDGDGYKVLKRDSFGCIHKIAGTGTEACYRLYMQKHPLYRNLKERTAHFHQFGHPSQEESSPACIHVRLQFVQEFCLYQQNIIVALCGSEMVNEPRQ